VVREALKKSTKTNKLLKVVIEFCTTMIFLDVCNVNGGLSAMSSGMKLHGLIIHVSASHLHRHH